MISQRSTLKSSAALLGGDLVASNYAEAQIKNVNTNSSPSNLKFTDLRMAAVLKPGPSPSTIIRIDTNEGVYGLGDGAGQASAWDCPH